MYERRVICNRCRRVITKPHPDRITIARQHYEECVDIFSKKNNRSVYHVEESMHFCEVCTKDFERFLSNEAEQPEFDFDAEFK